MDGARTPIRWTSLQSAIGELYLAASNDGLCCVAWEEPVDGAGDFPAYFHNLCRRQKVRDYRLEQNAAALDAAVREFEQYLAGQRQRFTLRRAPLWGTAFQRRVWLGLGDIPYGVTWSYGELARRIGRPKAVRAVGRANAANPLPIVTPCHRVIGGDGKLVGFASGLYRKQWLLSLEAARQQEANAVHLAAAR